MTNCPNCNGIGSILPMIPTPGRDIFTCPVCSGSGHMPDGWEFNEISRLEGGIQRQERKAAGMTLRGWCLKFGYDVVALGLMERGIRKVGK
jgi:hypothetical protein